MKVDTKRYKNACMAILDARSRLLRIQESIANFNDESMDKVADERQKCELEINDLDKSTDSFWENRIEQEVEKKRKFLHARAIENNKRIDSINSKLTNHEFVKNLSDKDIKNLMDSRESLEREKNEEIEFENLYSEDMKRASVCYEKEQEAKSTILLASEVSVKEAVTLQHKYFDEQNDKDIETQVEKMISLDPETSLKVVEEIVNNSELISSFDDNLNNISKDSILAKTTKKFKIKQIKDFLISLFGCAVYSGIGTVSIGEIVNLTSNNPTVASIASAVAMLSSLTASAFVLHHSDKKRKNSQEYKQLTDEIDDLDKLAVSKAIQKNIIEFENGFKKERQIKSARELGLK